jgi:hypothetical protein
MRVTASAFPGCGRRNRGRLARRVVVASDVDHGALARSAAVAQTPGVDDDFERDRRRSR